MGSVRPKKHLGQHFLTEPEIARSLAASITGHNQTNRVLEIGPGTGILTVELLQHDKLNLKVIDIDSESIAFLKKNYPGLHPDIIEGDFLKIDFDTLFGGESFIVAGNFPYNISSQILFRIFENKDRVPEMVGMFQREVAKRIAAGPGSKTYGILSVLIQIYYSVEYLFTVDEDVFDPPPKVKSGVLRLERNTRRKLPFPDKFMKTVVKTAFNQRRKTLRNSLKSMLDKEQSGHLSEILALRPEQLAPETFIELAGEIRKMQAS